VGTGVDVRVKGEGQDAPVHPRPDQLEPRAALHQPVERGLQELRQLHSCASQRTATKSAPLGMRIK